MASQVLTDVRIWLDARDVSGQANALAVEYGAEPLGRTSIQDSTRARIGGLKNVRMTHSGYWAPDMDADTFSAIGSTSIVTVAGNGSATGEPAYLSQALAAQYTPKLSMGELKGYTLSLEGAGPLIRGVILANEDTSSSGSSTPVEIGLLQQNDELYAVLHVTEISGGTLTVKIESDEDPSFSSPVDAITFSAASSATAEYKVSTTFSVDGYYRATWTLSGGSATFAVAAGLRVGVFRSLVTRADDQIVLRSGDILIIR